jgi:hypothetical protein
VSCKGLAEKSNFLSLAVYNNARTGEVFKAICMYSIRGSFDGNIQLTVEMNV